MTDERTVEEQVESEGITARYYETDEERVLEFESDRSSAAIAQNVEGYAMLKVRPSALRISLPGHRTPGGQHLSRVRSQSGA